METNLPPDFEMLFRIIDGQLPQVRELFQYALVMLMVENGKARMTERHVTDDAREHFTYRTNAGDVFTIIKPDVSDELLAKMTKIAREILRDDAESADADEK